MYFTLSSFSSVATVAKVIYEVARMEIEGKVHHTPFYQRVDFNWHCHAKSLWHTNHNLT